MHKRTEKPEDAAADVVALRSRQPTVRDPFVMALARFVQALDARYPDGPSELIEGGLAARANMLAMADLTDPGTS